MDIAILSMSSNLLLLICLLQDNNLLSGVNGAGKPGAPAVSYYGPSLPRPMLFGRGIPNTIIGVYT